MVIVVPSVCLRILSVRLLGQVAWSHACWKKCTYVYINLWKLENFLGKDESSWPQVCPRLADF